MNNTHRVNTIDLDGKPEYVVRKIRRDLIRRGEMPLIDVIHKEITLSLIHI